MITDNHRFKDDYIKAKNYITSRDGDTRIVQLGEEANPPSSMVQGSVIIYDYESGSYDGSGEAYMIKDKKLYFCSLSHCSCYGPWDAGRSGEINKRTESGTHNKPTGKMLEVIEQFMN